MMKQLSLSASRVLDLSIPNVMGILNVTPDSFSDGGQHAQCDLAVAHALKMVAAGATIIDIGGESTRPGASEVSVEEELNRVIPVIRALRAQPELDTIAISIDTSKPEVMTQAVKAGADIINDVRALQLPGALEAAAALKVPVCLMHMQGEPKTMQANPSYDDVVEDIMAFFDERIATAEAAGISKSQIILDPGFGFGKTLAHNYGLLQQFAAFSRYNMPLLAGLSRKSMFGKLLNRNESERLAASLAGALIAAQKGAHIIRVHDVAETMDVLNVWHACEKGIK